MDDNIYIFEDAEYELSEWLNYLKVSDVKLFYDLVNEGIFEQVAKSKYKNIFVGIIKQKNQLVFSLPKCFSICNYENEVLYKIIRLVQLTLTIYKKRIATTKAILYVDNSYLAFRNLTCRTEYDLYLSLKDNYYKNGFYYAFESKYVKNNSYLRVNWNQTVSKQQPIISSGAPIYESPLSKQSYSKENRITILHQSILHLLAKKYSSIETDRKLITTLSTQKMGYLSDQDIQKSANNWKKIIDNELRSAFKESRKELLLLLREYLSEDGSPKKNVFQFYGTNYFNLVWEDVVRVIMGDKRQTYIDRFMYPVYYISSNSKKLQQKPDLLLQKGQIFYIIDAKYYVVEKSLPGLKDVVKQFFYEKSFMNTTSLTCYSLFMFPLKIELNDTGCKAKNQTLGKIQVEHNGTHQTDFPTIGIYGLNPYLSLQCYVSNTPIDVF